MRVPIQSSPVSRGISTQAITQAIEAPGVTASGIACTICNAACNRLPSWPGFIRRGCRAVCSRTACRL